MRHIPIIKLEDVENDIATHQLIFKLNAAFNEKKFSFIGNRV